VVVVPTTPNSSEDVLCWNWKLELQALLLPVLAALLVLPPRGHEGSAKDLDLWGNFRIPLRDPERDRNIFFVLHEILAGREIRSVCVSAVSSEEEARIAEEAGAVGPSCDEDLAAFCRRRGGSLKLEDLVKLPLVVLDAVGY
jgi:hypothetical protein